LRPSNNKTDVVAGGSLGLAVSATLLAGLAAPLLLLAHQPAVAQTVSLAAGSTSTTLPDGQKVPMWGYTCGTASGALCTAANPGSGTGWSPVVISVPYTADATGKSTTALTITLTNNLTFTAGSGTNKVPTSL